MKSPLRKVSEHALGVILRWNVPATEADERTLRVYFHYALTLRCLGRWEEAEKMPVDVYKAAVEHHGPNDANTLAC